MRKRERKRAPRKGEGRPKEDVREKVDLGIVKRYAALGFTTNEELAYLLGVSVRTILRYKEDENFLASIQKAIWQADANVVASLYKRAVGFKDPKGKYYAPDVIACNSWLNNRRRHQFAWNPKPANGLNDDQTEQLRKLSEQAMDENL